MPPVDDSGTVEESMEGEDEDVDDGIVADVDVWPDNLPSVDVFRRCSIAIVSTGMGAQYTGIPLLEIIAVVNEVGTPADDRLALIDDVTYMGQVVAESRNKKMNKPSR